MTKPSKKKSASADSSCAPPTSGKTLLRLGIVGTVFVALCCFTPLLVALFAAIGLSAATGYLDYVLLPALVAFVALTMYALYRRKQCSSSDARVHPRTRDEHTVSPSTQNATKESETPPL